MDITIKNIAHLDSKKIYTSIYPNIGYIQESFKYLNIADDKYYKLIIKIIESTKNKYTGNTSYIDFITKEINDSLSTIVKKRLKNENISFNLINNYINQNSNSLHSISSALKFFDNLSSFFESYKYVPTIDTIINLFNDNQLFKYATELVFNTYKTEIISGKSEELFTNEFLASTIYGYCLINNISIEEDFNSDLSDIKGKDIVQDYLNEIGEKPLLSAEEERIIALKVLNGDELARNKLIEHNLRLVVHIASTIFYKEQKLVELKLLDLIQEGNMGLMVAAERFDVQRGYRFSTYACWWIRQKIYRAISNKERSIRIPISAQERIILYNKTVEELRNKLRREPHLEEIANYMGISTAKVRELYQIPSISTSINKTIDEDEETEVGDFIPSRGKTVEEQMIANKLSDEMIDLFQKCKLTQKQIDVLMLYYGFENDNPLSAEAIGKRYNCTRERIRQIIAKSIKKIRRSPYIKEFSVYMDYPEKAAEYIDEIRKKYIENPHSTKAYFVPSDNKKEENKMRKSHSIYELLKDYTKEQISEMLLKLTDEEISLLKLKYGNDLSSPQGLKLTKEQSYHFYGTLLPKMKKILTKMNRILIEQEQESTTTSNRESQPVEVVVTRKENDIKPIDANKVLELLRKPTLSDMMNVLTVKEIVIIALKLGYIDGKVYSTSSIAAFLEMDEKEILEITKKVLLLYKESINDLIDMLTNTINEQEQMEKTLVLSDRAKMDGNL